MNNLINSSNNKLLSILASFSKVELNRLKKFVESPYFNANQEITSLYQYLYNNYEEGLSFTKQELWQTFKREDTFNSLKFRKLFSDLLKLVEQFLSQEVYEDNKLLKANYLLKSVSNRNLKKLFSTSLSNAYRASEKIPHRESEYFLYQYQREKNIYELKNSDLDRNSGSNVNQIVNYLDYFYLAEKMRYLCEIIVRENIISMDYEILFRDEIVAHLKKYKYEEVPLVSIYYHMFLTLTEDDDKYYFKLKDLLEQHISIFPNYEAREIYTSAINYCLKKINSGQDEFLSEFLQLNESLLAKNIIAESELSPWRFKNIVTAGLKLTRFEWIENFIETYKLKIPERYRDNAVTFSNAQLLFYQKKYEELLPLLLQVDYEDFTYALSSKIFTVVTYFELGETETLFSYLDSFRTYLSRKKSIPENRKKRHLKFISYVKILLKFNHTKKYDLANLRNEISSTRDTVSKEWLLEKIDQLLYPNGIQRDSSTEYSNKQHNQGQ